MTDDLRPRRGLESLRVEQMGETFWRMRRSQRIPDGVAVKNHRAKVPGEDMAAKVRSSQVFEAMEPFERLHKALSRPGQGPTSAEIEWRHLLWHGHLGRDRSRARRPWYFQMTAQVCGSSAPQSERPRTYKTCYPDSRHAVCSPVRRNSTGGRIGPR